MSKDSERQAWTKFIEEREREARRSRAKKRVKEEVSQAELEAGLERRDSLRSENNGNQGGERRAVSSRLPCRPLFAPQSRKSIKCFPDDAMNPPDHPRKRPIKLPRKRPPCHSLPTVTWSPQRTPRDREDSRITRAISVWRQLLFS